MGNELAIDRGPSDVALLDRTIGVDLARTIAAHGNTDAIVSRHQDIRWTYDEFGDRVTRLASGLLGAGLGVGDRVGLPDAVRRPVVQDLRLPGHGGRHRRRIVARRSHQHPVHVGDDRVPQGRHPHAPQHPQQRILHHRTAGRHRRRPPLHPREIEEFVYTHPDIVDVQVIGVPDERYGEELMAWVKLVDGAATSEEDVKAFCQGRIAHYKIPRYVKFVDDFPMTVTGKVRKVEMREQSITELGR